MPKEITKNVNNNLKEKYLKQFKDIRKESEIETYKLVRKKIFEEYESKYRNSLKTEIQLELDRINTLIENLKSPFLSISIALIAMAFTLILPEFVNALVDNSVIIFKMDYILQIKSLLKIIIVVIYLVIILKIYGHLLSKKERKLICLIICKDVLEKLKQDDNTNNSDTNLFEEKILSYANIKEKFVTKELKIHELMELEYQYQKLVEKKELLYSSKPNRAIAMSMSALFLSAITLLEKLSNFMGEYGWIFILICIIVCVCYLIFFDNKTNKNKEEIDNIIEELNNTNLKIKIFKQLLYDEHEGMLYN